MSWPRSAGPARPTGSRRGSSIRDTGVTSGTMTNRVDRLAARRLVSREEHPADGRGVLVRLTEEGRATVDATLADLLAAERTMLDGLAEADRAQLVRTLRTLLSR